MTLIGDHALHLEDGDVLSEIDLGRSAVDAVEHTFDGVLAVVAVHALDVQHLLADDVVIELLLRAALDVAAPAAASAAAAKVAHHAAHGEEKRCQENRAQNTCCHLISFLPCDMTSPCHCFILTSPSYIVNSDSRF